MKKGNRITITSGIFVALVTLLSLVGGILANLAASTFIPITGLLSYSWVILVVASIALGILVIFQTAQEKRTNKVDNNKPTTTTKDITGRFILREGPLTIEAPDAEGAIEVYQKIHENFMKSENLLKAESQSMMEETKPEDWQLKNAPATETALGVIQNLQAIRPESLLQLIEELFKHQQKASDVPEMKEDKE
jgi:hypothetical protein